MAVYNEVSLLRNDFNKLYTAYKPDEIMMLQFSWVVDELICNKEQSLLSLNIELLANKQANKQ